MLQFNLISAVRYGLVPKRTRDTGGNTIVDDISNGIIVNSQAVNGSANIRVVNSNSAGVINSSLSTTNNCTNESGSGSAALLVSSQMCSTTTTTPPIEHYSNHITTDMIEASHMNNNNNNNNNNSEENQELSVYDVILCVSQGKENII